MPKDYAKRYKTQPSKKRKKPPTQAHSRSVFVFIVFLLVILAGGAGYYYYHHMLLAKASPTELPPVVNAKAESLKAKAPVEEAKEDPVDYQFYTLLPKISVPDPAQNTAPPGEQPGFWLQLMLYYNMRDASAYLDRLQLMGLDVVIMQRKSTKTDHDLFVVVLGPFTTKENAVARQQELKKNGISSYIYHVDPPASSEVAETTATQQASSVPVVNASPVDL